MQGFPTEDMSIMANGYIDEASHPGRVRCSSICMMGMIQTDVHDIYVVAGL